MKLFKARELAVRLQLLQKHQCACDEGKRAAAAGLCGPKPDQTELDYIIKDIHNAIAFCEDAGFDKAANNLKMADINLQSFAADADYSSLHADLRQCTDALLADIWDRKFVQIDKALSDHVHNPTLFGVEVYQAFRSARFDVEDGGNCLAVGCDTAAVFHFMRVAEYGLRALAHDRRIRIPRNRPIDLATWDDIIKELEKAEEAIRNYPATLAREAQFDFYHGAMMEFKRFKNKFRNQVMHARKSYDSHQAASAFEHVGSL